MMLDIDVMQLHFENVSKTFYELCLANLCWLWTGPRMRNFTSHTNPLHWYRQPNVISGHEICYVSYWCYTRRLFIIHVITEGVEQEVTLCGAYLSELFFIWHSGFIFQPPPNGTQITVNRGEMRANIERSTHSWMTSTVAATLMIILI